MDRIARFGMDDDVVDRVEQDDETAGLDGALAGEVEVTPTVLGIWSGTEQKFMADVTSDCQPIIVADHRQQPVEHSVSCEGLERKLQDIQVAIGDLRVSLQATAAAFSLRDRFACAAVQGMLEQCSQARSQDYDEIARAAYGVADAMLRHRV